MTTAAAGKYNRPNKQNTRDGTENEPFSFSALQAGDCYYTFFCPAANYNNIARRYDNCCCTAYTIPIIVHLYKSWVGKAVFIVRHLVVLRVAEYDDDDSDDLRFRDRRNRRKRPILLFNNATSSVHGNALTTIKIILIISVFFFPEQL